MMSDERDAPTLHEDWEQRRSELVALDRREPRQEQLLQLLDYLVERYRGRAEVAAPARFPRSAALSVNERAVIVHQHLGPRAESAVRNRADAERKVHDSLRRLSAHWQGRPADAGSRSDTDEDDDAPPHEFQASGKLWAKLIKRIGRGKNVDLLIERALSQSPFLPATAVKHLYERIDNFAAADVPALDFLLRCRNRSIPTIAVRAWRRRIIEQQHDSITQRLSEFLRQPDNRAQKHERIRIALADEDPQVRLAALAILAEIGDLDDIGLLSDLLQLSPRDDGPPSERAAIEATLQALAHIGK